MKTLNVPFILIVIIINLLYSCCFSVNEKQLGKNLYLSEYDNVDRRILYSKERCTGNGIELIPMTVTEFSYNTNWVLAKTNTRRANSQYWIIDKSLLETINNYNDLTTNVIHESVIGPIVSLTF
jgi:hypothetical protein